MADRSLHLRRWGRLCFVGVGLLALGLLVGGPGNPAAAQKTAKAQKKTGKDKDAEKSKGPPKIVLPEVIAVKDVLPPEVGGADQVGHINQEIEKAWQANKLTPADRCSDFTFIRRASLDLIGRIAKVSEIQQFLKDPAETRRARLIERLLASEEFPNHFANLWTNLLLTRSAGKIYHNQMHLWLYDQFEKKDADWKAITTEILTATGKSNDNGAVNFILAHLGEDIPRQGRNERGQPIDLWEANGRFEMVPVTSRTTRLFLGLRTQCTQCHDHPFSEEWKQSHFWGINAFFRQVDASARPNAMMKKGAGPNQPALSDNPRFNAEGLVPYERRNGLVEFQKAVFLDGRKMDRQAKNRRAELARLVTSSDYFAKGYVNRLWGHFFGRGFTKDVDDFGEHSPVSHPELLDRLAKDFVKHKHNPRDLIRWICNSRAYGLDSVANQTNDKADAEPFFSRMLLKALSPEQLFESLMTATEAKVAQNKDQKRKKREDWLTRLVVRFGDDEGSEGTFNGTVVQALLMMNGEDINNAITDKDQGTVAVILKRKGVTPRSAMHDLFLAALNRPPTEGEYQRMLSARMVDLPRLRPRRDAAFYTAFYQDLFWALLNSNEFILNH
jgi:hypothetical protein